jgi:hypothetical protein
MSKTEIIEDNEFFTAGIIEHQRGVFLPFFQSHEKEDDFEEEPTFPTKELALLRLAEIVIRRMDIITTPTEDCEDDMCDEPSISLVGGCLPHRDDF